MKQNKIRERGEVIAAYPSLSFKVRLENNREILAKLSGKLRIHHIRVLPGDRVLVELSPYDEKRGRIVYRLK